MMTMFILLMTSDGIDIYLDVDSDVVVGWATDRTITDGCGNLDIDTERARATMAAKELHRLAPRLLMVLCPMTCRLVMVRAAAL